MPCIGKSYIRVHAVSPSVRRSGVRESPDGTGGRTIARSCTFCRCSATCDATCCPVPQRHACGIAKSSFRGAESADWATFSIRSESLNIRIFGRATAPHEGHLGRGEMKRKVRSSITGVTLSAGQMRCGHSSAHRTASSARQSRSAGPLAGRDRVSPAKRKAGRCRPTRASPQAHRERDIASQHDHRDPALVDRGAHSRSSARELRPVRH